MKKSGGFGTFRWLRFFSLLTLLWSVVPARAQGSVTIYQIRELIQGGEWRDAMEKIRTLLESEGEGALSDTDKKDLYFYLGICFAELGHPALAIESWKKSESYGSLTGVSPPSGAKAKELWKKFLEQYSESKVTSPSEGPKPPPKSPASTSPSKWKFIVGLTSVAASAVFLGVGIAAGVGAMNNANEAVQRQIQAQRKNVYQVQAAPIIMELHSSAVTFSTISNISFVAAGLTGASGAAMLIWHFLGTKGSKGGAAGEIGRTRHSNRKSLNKK